ncbi:MAG: hypothetical protein ACR2M3_16465 [Thermomicrobiales bacterium]
MSAQPQPYKVNPENEIELARRLSKAETENEPVVVEIAGNLYRLVPEDDIQTTDDPAANYDPQKALAAVEAGFGAFKTMDVEAFLTDILEAREQDTPGHSF